MRNLTLNPANKQEAKVALVTGGARRIGASIINALHQVEYRVVIHCHSSLSEAHNLASKLNEVKNNSALVLVGDLSKQQCAAVLISQVEEWAGRLDVLVNNASLFIRTDNTGFNAKDWQNLFDVNVKAPYLLSLAARLLLAKSQGCIINLSDIHSEKPLKDYSLYCQTKAALEMQTKSLAREFAPNIRVNAVAPGAIAWPEAENQLSNELQQQIIAKTPLKQHGEPQFIAQAVLALIQNPFVTGQSLKVDGGRSIMN